MIPLNQINPPEAAEKVIQDQMKKLSMLEAASPVNLFAQIND